MSGSRRKPGPLGPWVDGYRVRLLELGYSPLSVTHSLTTLGHLGRWMDREKLDVEQLNEDVSKSFLADHVAGHGHLPSGVVPLLEYLRGEGAVPPEPARHLVPLDRLLGDYRDWLAVERALSPETVRGYTRLADRFLAERVTDEDQLGVQRLTGADVTGFLLRASRRVGAQRCRRSDRRLPGAARPPRHPRRVSDRARSDASDPAARGEIRRSRRVSQSRRRADSCAPSASRARQPAAARGRIADRHQPGVAP